MTPLRVLLIGLGVRGRQWNAVLSTRSDLSVAGVVEPSGTEDLDASVWATLEPGLAEGAFDVAFVCAPSERHAEMALACIGAGLDVVVEKPLALSLDDAVSIARTAQAAGRTALVAQN